MDRVARMNTSYRTLTNHVTPSLDLPCYSGACMQSLPTQSINSSTVAVARCVGARAHGTYSMCMCTLGRESSRMSVSVPYMRAVWTGPGVAVCTHAHTHTQPLSLSHARALSLSLPRTHTRTHAHAHAQAHKHAQANAHAHTQTHTHTLTHTHTHTHSQTRAHTRARVHTHAHKHIYTPTQATHALHIRLTVAFLPPFFFPVFFFHGSCIHSTVSYLMLPASLLCSFATVGWLRLVDSFKL